MGERLAHMTCRGSGVPTVPGERVPTYIGKEPDRASRACPRIRASADGARCPDRAAGRRRHDRPRPGRSVEDLSVRPGRMDRNQRRRRPGEQRRDERSAGPAGDATARRDLRDRAACRHATSSRRSHRGQRDPAFVRFDGAGQHRAAPAARAGPVGSARPCFGFATRPGRTRRIPPCGHSGASQASRKRSHAPHRRAAGCEGPRPAAGRHRNHTRRRRARVRSLAAIVRGARLARERAGPRQARRPRGRRPAPGSARPSTRTRAAIARRMAQRGRSRYPAP